MADNGFRINKSINLTPQAQPPANPVDGDIYYNSAIGSFVQYHLGAWANTESIGVVATAANLNSATFTPAIVQNSVVRLTGSTSGNIHGFTASFSAKRLIIYNNSTALQVIKNLSVGESTSNNQIITPIASDMNLVAGEIAQFIYDAVANRWALVSISSNAGAQIVATTVNTGIVKLHAVATTPSSPIVLSDGDINAANGVLGLNTFSAASITVTGGNSTALTLLGIGTGHGINAAGGSTSGNGVVATGGGTGAGITALGSSSGSAGIIATGTGNFIGIVAAAGGAALTTDLHTVNGIVAIAAFAGGTSGDAVVGQGKGVGRSGIYGIGDPVSNGHGVFGVATGSGVGVVGVAGSGFAGLFNGPVQVNGSIIVNNAVTYLNNNTAGATLVLSNTGGGNGLAVSNGCSIAGGLGVAGSANISGGVTINGGLNIGSGTLNCGTLASTANISCASFTTSGTINVSGTASITGSISTSGGLFSTANNSFTGKTTFIPPSTTTAPIHFSPTNSATFGSTLEGDFWYDSTQHALYYNDGSVAQKISHV